jgi:hypothetical protein
MNQDLINQEFAKPPSGTNGGATGTICSDTSLYKANDGKIEFVELIQAGDAFPPFPGGTGKKSTTWVKLNKTTDGSKQSFEGVLVPAGTL